MRSGPRIWDRYVRKPDRDAATVDMYVGRVDNDGTCLPKYTWVSHGC